MITDPKDIKKVSMREVNALTYADWSYLGALFGGLIGIFAHFTYYVLNADYYRFLNTMNLQYLPEFDRTKNQFPVGTRQPSAFPLITLFVALICIYIGDKLGDTYVDYKVKQHKK